MTTYLHLHLHLRRTVVFSIQFPQEISNKPLQVMATIADNTRKAICDTVNLYLNSKCMLKGIQGQRKVEIKYDVGRILLGLFK